MSQKQKSGRIEKRGNINKRGEAWVVRGRYVFPLQEISWARDKIFKSSGFFRIEYVTPLEKINLVTLLRREFRVWAIFQPGPLVSSFTPTGFSINFSICIYIWNYTLIIYLKIRVRSFFLSSLTSTNTFSNF